MYLHLAFTLGILSVANGQGFSLFDYEDPFVQENHVTYDSNPVNPTIIEAARQQTLNVIPLREVTFNDQQQLSLFDNEPITLQQNSISRLPVRQDQPVHVVENVFHQAPSATERSTLFRENSDSYSQFSTSRLTSSDKDAYKLHGQSKDDGKNTQIIINLSNEPKSYLGYDQASAVDSRSLFRDDFIGPPAPPTTAGAPAPPPIFTTTNSPPHGHYGQTTQPSVHYGQPMIPQAEPTFAAPPLPQAPPSSYGAPPAQDPLPSYGAPPAQDPQPSYGAPPAQAPLPPAPPPNSYGVPQAPPVSYGSPPAQAPPAAPPSSYGVPQAPPVSYGPPPPQDPVPSYGAPPPPQDEVVQTQFVMPSLTLHWQQPTMRSPPAAAPPAAKPSYDAPPLDSTQNDFNGVSGDVHYHVHVNELDDVQQLDQVFNDNKYGQQQGQLSAPPSPRPNRNPRRRPPANRDPRRRPRRPAVQRDFATPPTASNLSEFLKLKCFIWCFFTQAQYERSDGSPQ